MTTVVGVDAGSDHQHDAEELGRAVIQLLGAPDAWTLGCTHTVRRGIAHHAGTVSAPLPAPPDAATLAATLTESTGRPVVVVVARVDDRVVGADVVVDCAGDPAGRDGATAALVDRLGGHGRAFVFPGWAGLRGRLTVAEALAGTAIVRIRVLGSPDPAGSMVLDTRDFVRPRFEDGELVLPAMPARDSTIVPFEAEHEIACCAAPVGS